MAGSSGANNKKMFFGGEEEDAETASLFGNPGVFTGDRNLSGVGPSPHQFNAMNLYQAAGPLPQASLAAAVAASQGSQAAAASRAQLGRQVSQPALPSNSQAGFPLGPVVATQPLSSSPSNVANRGLGSLFGAVPTSTSRSSNDLLERYNDVGFDPSEFPQLGSRPSAQQNSLGLNRNYVGLMSKGSQEQSTEFKMSQEDFPALPGAQNPASSSGDTPRSTSTPGSVDGSSREGARFPGDTSSGGNLGPVGQRKGITTSANHMVSNIPDSMLNNKFGIAGLLSFIRGAETDPGICALAPGVDLTTLGLNLNSTEPLHQTFQSPWSEQPCRPQDIDFHVPSEYQTNIFIKDKLAQIKLNRYTDDVLFFLFYFFTGDCLQLLAAAELFNRDWRYHKDEKVWVTRPPHSEPKYRTKTGENGTYYVFDRSTWQKTTREMYLEYDKLEERPALPGAIRGLVGQPAQIS